MTLVVNNIKLWRRFAKEISSSDFKFYGVEKEDAETQIRQLFTKMLFSTEKIDSIATVELREKVFSEKLKWHGRKTAMKIVNRMLQCLHYEL